MRDYIFSRLLSIDAKTDDDVSDVLFGGKDSILPPKEEEKKEEPRPNTWEAVDPKPPVIRSGHLENRIRN